jgi:predicted metal-dependent hydrolase
LSPTAWQECEEYLFGIDLFNHGYYWEAHESWEAVWHAAGRKGTAADFLKGLIKLAAAGVKAREGSAAGAQRHARRCRELLLAVESSAGSTDGFYAGLSLRNVVNMADAIAAAATERAVPLGVYDAVLRVESPR